MEVKLILQGLFVLFLIGGGLCSAAAQRRRGLLWGSAFTTVGVVGALWVSEVSSVTALAAVIFMIFDLILFVYSGATKLIPAASPKKSASGHLYSALVVWVIMAFVMASFYFIWGPDSPVGVPNRLNQEELVASVLGGMWSEKGFYLYLIVAFVFASVLGAFFMIEKEG